MSEYALDYYKQYFTDDSEIHFIVNFNYNTTTKIMVMGGDLDVTVQEYVAKEEHDAKMLGSGTVLAEYFVNIENALKECTSITRTYELNVRLIKMCFVMTVEKARRLNAYGPFLLLIYRLCVTHQPYNTPSAEYTQNHQQWLAQKYYWTESEMRQV